MTDATVTAHEPMPGRIVITVAGEIDLENVARVERSLHDAINNQASSVHLDLGALDYLDSAGIRVLFGLAGRLELLQIAVDAQVDARTPVRKAVELSGLAQVLHLRVAPDDS